ncbi:MAG: TIGR03936 family radical SAM-associated protein [Christensenella sp.]|nr:TIGR03936 family radical SAM-associated protein [Christensenella sp.]
MNEEKHKMIIQYSRNGAARYISHLDMQRAFGRAVRRAKLPACYSKGFNPHIIMSFASPLSVGYATEGDYLELPLAVVMDPQEIKDALNAVMPPDLRIIGVHEMGEPSKKLMAQNYSASYSIYFHFENEADCDTMKDAVKVLYKAKNYLATDRRGKEIDIRPLVFSVDAQNGRQVNCKLKNASDGALNPAVLATALLKEAGVQADYDICREDCFALENGKEVPFSRAFRAE